MAGCLASYHFFAARDETKRADTAPDLARLPDSQVKIEGILTVVHAAFNLACLDIAEYVCFLSILGATSDE